MTYLLLREPIISRDDEVVVLGKFKDWHEVALKAEEESTLEENNGYRIYVHVTSDDEA